MVRIGRMICALLVCVLMLQCMAIPASATEDNGIIRYYDSEGVLLPPGFMEIVREDDEEPLVKVRSSYKPEEREVTYSSNGIPLYFQTDYPNVMYGAGNIASSGCGITCLAMVATYLTGHEYLPDELADYFGGRAENNIARMEIGAETLQLPWKRTENWHETLEELQNGKVAIALMCEESIFTESQHFIVLTNTGS